MSITAFCTIIENMMMAATESDSSNFTSFNKGTAQIAVKTIIKMNAALMEAGIDLSQFPAADFSPFRRGAANSAKQSR